MTEEKFHIFLQRRLAQVSINAPAIRNQGEAGIINIIRDYCEKIDLVNFSKALRDESEYKQFLNYHTEKILESFVTEPKSWGGARKGLNLFLREVVYNNFFSHKFSLPNNYNDFNNAIRLMEIPLDRDVAIALIKSNKKLNPWKSIKSLTQELNEEYQYEALRIGNEQNTARVNLDLIYWRKNK